MTADSAKPDDDSPEALDARQDRLAFEVARGVPIKRAAKLAGCGESTAHGWLKLAAVKKRIRKIRNQIYSETLGLLVASHTKAAKRLVKLAVDEDKRLALRAIELLFSAATALQNTLDINERMGRIEAFLAEQMAQEKKRRESNYGRR
jgi:hypothetical protein